MAHRILCKLESVLSGKITMYLNECVLGKFKGLRFNPQLKYFTAVHEGFLLSPPTTQKHVSRWIGCVLLPLIVIVCSPR